MARSTSPAAAPVALALAVLLTACGDSRPTEPEVPLSAVAHRGRGDIADLAAEVRVLAAGRGIGRVARAPHVRAPLVKLGRALAFDPVLSGTRDISCMTCHHPELGTGDGRSLSIGQGGAGLGPVRAHPTGTFIPRNAPPLYNLGSMRRLFWDGRVSVDEDGDFHTPAGAQLTPAMSRVFEFGAVSALAMFPVTNRLEMRGFEGNELAALHDDDFTGIWKGIMRRLGRIPEYRKMFEAAYPGTRFERMTFAHASNAIGGFFVSELTFTDTPWDRFLAGRDHALDRRQLEGAKMFMTLRCSICHGGPTFSDQEFHNVAVAQLGPGVGNGLAGFDDFGRWNVTGLDADRYRFRSTPLRNVELTAPYGHDGAIMTLRDFIAHYSESDRKLRDYDPGQLEALLRGTVVRNADAILATRDTLLDGVVFGDDILDQLMDFMGALTDDRARHLRRMTPRHVPSGLPVDRP